MLSNEYESLSLATRDVHYRDQYTALTGVLHWNGALPGRKPGVLLVHGGAGLDEHARDQARRYAELGYAVFACDMYGDGVAGNRERIMAHLTTFRDNPAFLVRRAEAGLKALSEQPEVRAGNVAAIGFCFGGMAALALARSGANLSGVVSIHGGLTTSAPAEPGSVKAKVLVCHGAADPHVPMTDIAAFTEEMNHAGADWKLISYGRALHGFTHRHGTPGTVPGVAYDPIADKCAFTDTRAFLAEVVE
ncbi:MAG TPA: dienelactone hydrolase family protein [Amycolatopsis sp.]|nr:dienelactone hydrolase family protein [Amycolatopsis sp.]